MSRADSAALRFASEGCYAMSEELSDIRKSVRRVAVNILEGKLSPEEDRRSTEESELFTICFSLAQDDAEWILEKMRDRSYSLARRHLLVDQLPGFFPVASEARSILRAEEAEG